MNPFVPLVPRLWTAEQALAAVTLLRSAIDAIWNVHGQAMVDTIAEDPDRWNIGDLVDLDDERVDDHDLDDDLPY
ncbi:hypothetical protein L6R53_03330 [Myxococcota bacterium]|nr:hypothetical protein [Myxococcota bacterium]